MTAAPIPLHPRPVTIHLRAAGFTAAEAEDLAQLLATFPGRSPVFLHLLSSDGTGVAVKLGDTWKVTDVPELWSALEASPSLAALLVTPEERRP